MVKTKLRQKIGLIALSIFLTLIILEIGLNTGGLILYSLQRSGNEITEDKNEYRILALGESTTADLFNWQSSWPAELEQILNNRSPVIKFKVFNEGISGINSIHILNNLEGDLRKYNPNMVIAMIGINDIAISEETTKKNRLILFFMELKVVNLFDLIYSHWGERLSNIKGNIYKKVFKKSSDASLRNGASYYDLFYHTWSRGNTEEMLKKAIELNPEDYMAYVQLGVFYHAQNRLENAEDMLKKAIELDSENDMAYVGLGLVYNEQKKFKNAGEMFKKAILLNPDDEGAYMELGRAYYNQGKFKEAGEMFKKAIELNPDEEWEYIVLGWVYYRQGKFDEAEEILKKAIGLNPDKVNLYMELGRAYYNQGKFKEAGEMFKKAIELNPDDEWVYMELERAYYNQGKFKEAEDTFKQGIKLNPDNEEADFGVEELHLGLGLLYDMPGKFDEAEDLYNKLSKIEGSNPVLSENYQRMYRILNEKGIKFAVMQYPLKNVDELKNMFDESQQKNTIFISNEENFKSAINNVSFADYFIDMFGGSFGHCTLRGNRLIAENVADVIMAELGIS